MKKLKNSRIEELKFLRVEKLKNLSLAALLMAGAAFAACSSSDDSIDEIQQPANQTGPKTYTLTIKASMGESALTRALYYDEGTKTLTPAWATGEKIYVFNGTKTEALGGYLEATGSGATVTLGGEVTGTVEAGDELYLRFPQLDEDYTGQDGTLATIASTYDYALGVATVTDVSSGKITAENYDMGGPVEFDSQQAIVKFTLLNKDDHPNFNATSLTINARDAASNEMLIQTLDFASSETTFGPITIKPSPATNVIYAALATADSNTSYDFTLTATDGSKIYTCTKKGVTLEYGKYYEITVKMTEQSINYHGYVEMGDGLKWATCNIGATNPWDYGDYYSWGAIWAQETYDWANYPHILPNYGGSSDYINKYTFADNHKQGIWYFNGNFIGDELDGVEHRDLASYELEDDAARQRWHGIWHIPTNDEWTALHDDTKFTWEWTDNYNGTGVKGCTVTSKVIGYVGNQIFLPADGRRKDQSTEREEQGYYWSASLSPDYTTQAWCMHFASDGKYRGTCYRYYGMLLRPVSE